MRRNHVPAIAAAIALLTATRDVDAQSSRVYRPARVPAAVVLVDRLPVPGAQFVVQRRPDLNHADVILLLPSAGPSELSDAVRTLITARQAGGDFPIDKATIRMRPKPGAQPARRIFPWSERVLTDLHGATPRAVSGLGTVRAIEIFLPRQQRRTGRAGLTR
jgi:hypothetical protein